ncbi:DODA-type extradiol aromatic ring-opening family dioxygenase [Panacagrimonas sp.]|uniref:DODA-type extradiol aromatic ring-opening family dioxygenase n=1 Tax=Panacagrimonas sp. TaxID=2480088 RepID=UPI003B52E011
MNAPVSLFLGHGAPSLALSAHPAAGFLRGLGTQLERPRAVIVVSPHRMGRGFDVGCSPRFEAWHDFSGFQPALYELQYSPPGAPELAAQAQRLIAEAGLPGTGSPDPRIDHGVWVPLRLIWPDASVPVIPVATTRRDARAHLALGRALRPLADAGCLIVGSGSITHNLGDLDRSDEFAAPVQWAQAFDAWIAHHVATADFDALCDYRQRAPHAAQAHPTDEHLLPLFVALGAGGAGRLLYQGFGFGSLSLASYAFDRQPDLR